MPIKDTFSYSARWDSVGLDCSSCSNFVGPAEWPDRERVSRCRLHGISLAIELGGNGHKKWEWFCKHFEDSRSLENTAVEHFKSIQAQLQDRILYRLYGENGYLVEYPFDKLEKSAL